METTRYLVRGIPSQLIRIHTDDLIPVNIQFYKNRNPSINYTHILDLLINSTKAGNLLPSINYTGRVFNVERVYMSTTATPTGNISLVASDQVVH